MRRYVKFNWSYGAVRRLRDAPRLLSTFLLKSAQKCLARTAKFFFESFCAIAIAAGPRFGPILVLAIASRVRVLHA